MPAFDEAIEAQLDGRTVRCAQLVRFDFRSGVTRLWQGFGDVVIGGETYVGLHGLGRCTSSNAGPGQAAEEWTYQLFGDDTIIGHVREDAEEAIDRDVEDFWQFFDLTGVDESMAWVDWRPLGSPFVWRWGVMGPLSVQRPVAQPGEPAIRIVSVTAQNAFTNRRRPSNSFFSDLDQKARSPGDNIFVSMSRVSRKIAWPVF